MTKRLDYEAIAEMVAGNAKVLDLGCGNGDLMQMLVQKRNATVQGIELDDESIHACVEKGLSVFHSDIDSGLPYYSEQSFDYALLNQSIQQVKSVENVIKESLRVASKAIIGFPNFAHIEPRSRLFFGGKAPIAASLPYEWFSTPNLRFLSIKDFRNFCDAKKYRILSTYFFSGERKVRFLPNIFAQNAVFLIEKISN